MKEATIRKIRGFEGYYITRGGKVLSRKQNTLKVLSQYDNKQHYQRVKLYKDGKKYQPMVHILVITHFKDIKIKEGYEIDHIDRNIKNNHISNLQQLTKQENLAKREGQCK